MILFLWPLFVEEPKLSPCGHGKVELQEGRPVGHFA